MKIITATAAWDIDRLYILLKQQLNQLFKEHRQSELIFDIEKNGNSIIISKPGLYDGYLFKITVEGNELHMAKSEHYVDDVNQLTLQSILETLQMTRIEGSDIIYISGE